MKNANKPITEDNFIIPKSSSTSFGYGVLEVHNFNGNIPIILAKKI